MSNRKLSTQLTSRNTTSFSKLNKAYSQHRFRIKSLSQIKTSSPFLNKYNKRPNYQKILNNNHLTQSFLQQLFITKFQTNKINFTNQSMYQAYLKSLNYRLLETNTIQLIKCNFQKQAAELFLTEFININKNIYCYNLSYCSYLLHAQSKISKQWIIQYLIKNDQKIVKLVLRNMSLSGLEISKIFTILTQIQKIYELDLGNDNSQSTNKFGQYLSALGDFLKTNQITAVLKLDNMSLANVGVEQICRGVSANTGTSLQMLSLKNNAITQQAWHHISLIVRSGLRYLDLSDNPLGSKFFLNLPSWKQSTLTHLNLSNTNMNSQSLIFFMTRLIENTHLQLLKLDRNDYSNHWFNQIKDIIQNNSSIEVLSLVDCKIKRMNEIFLGLIFNRYIKKINISNNHIQEGVKQLCHLLKENKVIVDLRMRLCGLKSKDFIGIFTSLFQNQSLSYIDISQNQLQQSSNKQLLKTLTNNSNITHLLLDKIPIPYAIREQIQKKLTINRGIKKNKQIINLKKQNQMVKRYDQWSWDDVDNLDKKFKENLEYIEQLHQEVNNLQQYYNTKKINTQLSTKQLILQSQTITKNIQYLKTRIKQFHIQQKIIIKQFYNKQQLLKQIIKKQQQSIIHLQTIIAQQNIRNQARQNQLEDQYQNLKYIHKRNQAMKQRNRRLSENEPHKEKGLDTKKRSKKF